MHWPPGVDNDGGNEYAYQGIGTDDHGDNDDDDGGDDNGGADDDLLSPKSNMQDVSNVEK